MRLNKIVVIRLKSDNLLKNTQFQAENITKVIRAFTTKFHSFIQHEDIIQKLLTMQTSEKKTT